MYHLDYYEPAELQHIVERSARVLDVRIDAAGAATIAQRSRGTPRIANRLLRRVRDFAEVRADGVVTGPVADEALRTLFAPPQSTRRLLLPPDPPLSPPEKRHIAGLIRVDHARNQRQVQRLQPMLTRPGPRLAPRRALPQIMLVEDAEIAGAGLAGRLTPTGVVAGGIDHQ